MEISRKYPTVRIINLRYICISTSHFTVRRYYLYFKTQYRCHIFYENFTKHFYLPSKLMWCPFSECQNIGQSTHDRIVNFPFTYLASLVAQKVKHLPAIWETWVQSLGQIDPLEKEMATHSSILAWRIAWTEELGGLQQSMGSQRVGHS